MCMRECAQGTCVFKSHDESVQEPRRQTRPLRAPAVTLFSQTSMCARCHAILTDLYVRPLSHATLRDLYVRPLSHTTLTDLYVRPLSRYSHTPLVGIVRWCLESKRREERALLRSCLLCVAVPWQPVASVGLSCAFELVVLAAWGLAHPGVNLPCPKSNQLGVPIKM